MAKWNIVDITELATLGGQFPLRLMQLGFHLMQMTNPKGRVRLHYVLPPVCEVPAGPFLMGSDPQHDPDAQDNELPQHTVTLATFAIGTYPVTVAELACFVPETQGAGLDMPEPRGWSHQLQHPDHPVVEVSRIYAMAYTGWLSEVTGEVWRMPTEAEWEKAARGTDGRIFPWGDQEDDTRVNTDKAGSMFPVGCYPSGASPYGAQDMIGNVWEWTSTEFRDYPFQADDGRKGLGNLKKPAIRIVRLIFMLYI
jgi:formylglycine-generating enzyme required for sulfatase activity